MHDLHESQPLMYTFSGQAPQNPTLDPILYAELPWFSNFELTKMISYGMPGVWTHAFVDMWSPGYLGFMASNHNGMLRMYETFGNGGANTLRRQREPVPSTQLLEQCVRRRCAGRECLFSESPLFAPVRQLFVHHTVTANNDADPARTIRLITKTPAALPLPGSAAGVSVSDSFVTRSEMPHKRRPPQAVQRPVELFQHDQPALCGDSGAFLPSNYPLDRPEAGRAGVSRPPEFQPFWRSGACACCSSNKRKACSPWPGG